MLFIKSTYTCANKHARKTTTWLKWDDTHEGTCVLDLRTTEDAMMRSMDDLILIGLISLLGTVEDSTLTVHFFSTVFRYERHAAAS